MGSRPGRTSPDYLHASDQPLGAARADPPWQSSLLEAVGAAMVGVNPMGQTVFWSRGAEALFGWSAEDVLGQVPPIVPLPLRQEWRLQMQQVLDTGKPTSVAETQRLARDGRVIPVLRLSAPLRDTDGRITGLLDTLVDITAQKQLDEESRALAQVRERQLIAMDLHDGLVQSLYGVVLSLAARERGLDPAHAAAGPALRAARVEIDRVIEETRTYLFDMRVRAFAPRDLGSGLRLLADGLRLNAKIEVDLVFDPRVDQLLQPEVRGHVLYLAREAISNVLRHAHATCVRIEVVSSADRIGLNVADNGRGFTAAARSRRGHHGLRNMAERARLVGGHLDIETKRGKGTQLHLEVPIYKLPH